MNLFKRGFSLIEIIIAVSIMTIMAGLAIPVASVMMDKAKEEETKNELVSIQTATELYFTDTWVLPGDLEQLLTNTNNVTGWVGPYLNAPLTSKTSSEGDVAVDAWDHAYQVTYPSPSSISIVSRGRDGVAGNEDDISLNINITQIRRKSTLEEMEIINTAINAYNKVYLNTNPLLPDWDTIYNRLVATGLLPAGEDGYRTDGWGADYAPDPPGQTPVVRITSPNIDV